MYEQVVQDEEQPQQAFEVLWPWQPFYKSIPVNEYDFQQIEKNQDHLRSSSRSKTRRTTVNLPSSAFAIFLEIFHC